MKTLHMKTLHQTLIASALAGVATGAIGAADLSAIPSGSYEVDPEHAYVTFSYNHLGLSNPQLSFDDFTVDLNLDNEDPTKSMVNVTISANSIVAGSETWKDHLTSADWFDVAKYPDITFQSTTIEPQDDGSMKVNGDLKIKDQTSPVTLTVMVNNAMEHPMNGTPTLGLDATGTTLRSDFGMDKFAPNVSDEVELMISAELAKVE